MDNIKAMRLFLTVVQLGSLSSAGRQTGLSPASVSRQITALEDHLGVRLLNRTSRRLSLTEAGQVYLEHAKPLLEDMDELKDRVHQMAASPRGTLRVLSRVALGTHHVAPLIQPFLAEYPEIRIDLWLSDNDLDLTEHGIDLAVRMGNPSDSTLIGRFLGSSPAMVCASPEYWSQRGKPTTPEQLREHNCLAYRFEFGTAAALWQFRTNEGHLKEVRVKGNYKTNNGEALRVAALSGLGIAHLPVWLVKENLQAGELESALTEYQTTVPDLDSRIYAVYLSRRNLSIKTRLFIDHLAAGFKKQDWS